MRKEANRLGLCALALLACGAPEASPAPASSPAEDASVPETEKVDRAAAASSAPATRPQRPKRGISAMAVQQADALKKRFRAPKGTPLCDTDALARLQLLRTQHGTARPIKEALIVAYEACDERAAKAELLAQTLGKFPSDEAKLALAAAWIEAERFEEARAVAEPLVRGAAADSQAAWLLGMALAYQGRADEAIEHLRAARQHAGGPSGVDANTLVALACLELDRPTEAIEEIEKGLLLAPEHPPLLALASRAYTAAGRPEDAKRMGERARAAHQAINEREAKRARIDALRRSLNEAWQAERFDEVEALIDRMWPLADARERIRLLKNRAALLERTDRAQEARAVREQLAKMMKGAERP